MSRGFGMVVDEDKQVVRQTGVGQGLIRGFNTNLPTADNSQLINAGKSLQGVADDLLRVTGTEAAEKAARETKIGQDADGNYIRPETPMMGLALRGHFNKIVDQSFIERVHQDLSADLNQIQVDHFQDPQVAGPKMAQAVTARLNKVGDEGLKNQLGMLAGRDVNERMRSIATTRSHMDFGNEVEHLKYTMQQHTDRYFSALTIGDDAKAAEEMELIRNAQGRKVAMGVDGPFAMEKVTDDLRQMGSAAKIYRVLEQKLEDGTLTEQHFRLYSAWLAGGGSDEDKLDGVTKRGIFESMPSEKVRDHLRSKLGAIYERYKVAAGARAASNADEILETHWKTVGRGQLPTGASETDFTGYYQRRFGSELTPDGIQKIWTIAGDVPETMIKKAFAGARGGGAEKAKQLLQVYQTLATLPTPDGSTTGVKLAAISDSDAAFMYHFAQGRTTDGQGDKEAAEKAEAMVARGEKEWKDVGQPMAILKEALGRDPTITAYSGGVTNATVKAKVLATAKELGDGGAQDLDPRAETVFFGAVARRVALGQPLEEATAGALATFHKTWTYDESLYSGGAKGRWVPAGTSVPKIPDVTGKRADTDDYMKPIVAALLRAKPDRTQPKDEEAAVPDYARWIPKVQQGNYDKDGKLVKGSGIDISDGEWGKNIKAIPAAEGGNAGNPTFNLIYTYPDGRGIVLRDHELRPVKIQLGEEARVQSKAAVDYLNKPGGYEADLRRAQTAGTKWGVSDIPDLLAGRTPGTYGKPAPGGVVLDRVIVREDPSAIKDPGIVSKSTGGRGRGFAPDRVNDGSPELFKPSADLEADDARFVVQNFAIDERRKQQVLGMHPGFAKAVAAGVRDMPPEVRRAFRVVSAHRSHELQQHLWDNEVAERGSWAAAKAAGMVAQPGRSNHERGQAIDIDRRSPGASAAIEWWHANAEKYGLFFPMKREPWHMEPIRKVPVASNDPDGDDLYG